MSIANGSVGYAVKGLLNPVRWSYTTAPWFCYKL